MSGTFMWYQEKIRFCLRFSVGELNDEKKKLVHTVTTEMVGGMSKLLYHSTSRFIMVTVNYNIVFPAGNSKEKYLFICLYLLQDNKENYFTKEIQFTYFDYFVFLTLN